MARQFITDRHSQISIRQVPAEAIKYSVWNSYENLLEDSENVDKYLEGYDIDVKVLENLFSDWNKQIIPSQSVAITTCNQYARQPIWNALSKVLETLHFESKIRAARSIFIKVGLIQAVRWSEHVTTVPIFLDVLISILRAIQPDAEIQIGDGSGHERDTDIILRECGIAAILKKYKDVRFVDLNMDDLSVVEVPNPATLSRLVVPRSLLNADLIISLAKLKTHKWTGVSLGMKNMFGALPGSIYGFPKNRLHWACFPRVISDIWSATLPELVLIDGIVGIEGSGPLNGEKVKSNIVIAGCDPVATDGAATQLMGISPHIIPTFWFASLKHLGNLGPGTLRDEVRPFIKAYVPPPNKEWLYSSVYKTDEEQFSLIKSLLLKGKDS